MLSHVQLFGTLWTVVHQDSLSFLRLHRSTAFQTLLLTIRATPLLLRDSCGTRVPCAMLTMSSGQLN